MALEDLLRKKAEEKARAERDLADKESADLAESERLKRIQDQESQVASVKESLENIGMKIQDTQALLDDLKQTHGLAKESVSETLQEKTALESAKAKIETLLHNEDYRTVLAEDGIHSIEDLLNHDTYADEEDVKAVNDLAVSHPEKRQAAREAVLRRSQVKKEAHDLVSSEDPEHAGNLTYKSVVGALETLLGHLQAKHQELFAQTPEGLKSVKEEVLARIKERQLSSRAEAGMVISKDTLHKLQTVTSGDISDAEKYGSETVKQALKDHYDGRIDVEVSTKTAKEDPWRDDISKKEIEVLASLSEKWANVSARLKDLFDARQATTQNLAQIVEGRHDSLPENVPYDGVSRMGIDKAKNPYDFSQAFIEALSRDNRKWFNMPSLKNGEGFSVEASLKGVIDTQSRLSADINHYSVANAFQNVDGIRNPDTISSIIERQMQFYADLDKAMADPEAFFDRLISVEGNVGHNLSPYQQWRSQGFKMDHPDIVSTDYEKSKLEFAKKWGTFDGSLSTLKRSLQEREMKESGDVIQLKAQINDKVEYDWASSELNGFMTRNDRVIRECNDIYESASTFERFLSEFQAALLPLRDMMDQEILVWSNDVSFRDLSRQDLADASNVVSEHKKLVQAIDDRIRAIENRASHEGDGLFNRKKKAREDEIAQENKNKEQEQILLQTAEESYVSKKERDDMLNPLRTWLKQVKSYSGGRRIDLTEFSTGGAVPIANFKQKIDERLTAGPTEEQMSIYKTYQELSSQKEQAGKVYSRWNA